MASIASADRSMGTASPSGNQGSASPRGSVYEQLNGSRDEVQGAISNIFYAKVLADDRIRSYFENVDMQRQKLKFIKFMMYSFKGPDAWHGKSMAEVHKPLGLTEMHFNAVCDHFKATLQEMGVPPATIGDAMAVVASTKDDIIADDSKGAPPVN